MAEAQIEIYARQTDPDNLFSKIKKITEEDSSFIKIFLDNGFSPVIHADGLPCRHARTKESDGFVLIYDEEEFIDDWEALDAEDQKGWENVRCIVNFGTPPDMDRKIWKKNVKFYFEHLLQYKSEQKQFADNFDDELMPYWEIDRLLKIPIAHQMDNRLNSVTGIGDPIPDGRKVISVIGGEYSEKVLERLKLLDTSVLKKQALLNQIF